MLNEGAVVKLEGMDPEMAESVANQVENVLNRYPSTKDAFAGFTTEGPARDYFNNYPNAMACYDVATSQIWFNTKYFGNKAEFEKRYEKCVANKHGPEGTTAHSVVVHEMGHAIDFYVSEKIIDSYKFRWGGERISSRMWNNDIKAGKKSGTPLTGESITNGLSRYASKNHYEYMAEGFSEFMTSPNPRPTATKIGKRVEQYIKKAEKVGN